MRHSVERSPGSRVGFPGRLIAVIQVIFAALALAGASGHAEPWKDIQALHEDLYRGELGALYDHMELFLQNNIHAPESALFLPDLVRLADVAGHARVKQALNSILGRCAELPESRRNFFIMKIGLQLEKLAAAREPREVKGIVDGLAPVREWSISGPYHRYGAYDINYPWLPEAARDLRSMERKSVKIERADALLDFNELLYPEKGVAYAITTLAHSGSVRLRIQSECSYVVFLNGKEALRNVEGETFRSTRVLEVNGNGSTTVMIKVMRGRAWSFRMMTSDVNDVPLPCAPDPDIMVFNARTGTEIMEYPYRELVDESRAGSAESYFKLGNYFQELDSDEAIAYYSRACVQDTRGINRYFLASSMLEHSHGARDSAYALEATRILDALSSEFPDFVPVAHRKFQKLIEQRSLREACTMGAQLVSRAPRYLPLREDYSELLRALQYEKEFDEHATAFARDFPHSVSPSLERAEYYRVLDAVRSEKLCRGVLAQGSHEKAFTILFALLRSQGRNGEALSLIEQFNREGSLNDASIDVLVDSGDYSRARRLLFRNSLARSKPADLVRLGLVSYLEGNDPSMDWQKALLLNPSDFSTADLLDYVRKGRIEPPLSEYRNGTADARIIEWSMQEHGAYSSEIVYRSLVFGLNEDGSTRALCDDVFYVHDQKGVEKLGEYKVPFRGTMHPLRARVYAGDGTYTDSYRIEEVNGYQFINLSFLKEKSIVHVSYYIDNPFSIQGGADFTVIPFMLLQDFEEPVRELSCKIIVPATMRIALGHGTGINPVREPRGDATVYSIALRDLPYVKHEDYAGGAGNHLPYIAASTMLDASDFMLWYSGLLMNKPGSGKEANAQRFLSKSPEESVTKVFAHVENEIDLSGEALYYPDSPRDVEYKKRGTPEDKVLLAQNILDACGIKSYPAFVRRKDLPDPGGFISPDVYTDILLYIPEVGAEGTWLDFSKKYSGFASVNPSLQGCEALVLAGTGYERKTVRSGMADTVERDFRFVLDDAGNAGCTISQILRGQNATVREYFVDRYSIENMKSVDAPLVLSVSGRCFSIAPPLSDKAVLGMPTKSLIRRYIQSSERTLPLYILENIGETERYTYVLPDRFMETPFFHEEEISCRFGKARIRIEKRKGSAQVHMTKEVTMGAVRIDPEHYKEFLEFCMKLSEAEQRNVVIAR